MPTDLNKKVHSFANNRIRVVFHGDKYRIVAGTNTNRTLLKGKLEDLASVAQIEHTVTKIKKDESEYEAVAGTSRVSFVGTNGKVLGVINCNAPPHAASVVALFYMYLCKDIVDGIESSFDPDPTKKPPVRKSATAPRSSKKSPAATASKSKSSSSKSSNSKSSSSEEKKKKTAKAAPAQDDSDDGEDLVSSDDE